MSSFENDTKKNIVTLSLSVLSFFAAALVFLLIFSGILSCTKDPLEKIFPAGLAVLCLSALTGGIITSCILRSFPKTLLSGGLSAALLYTVSLFFENSGNISPLLQALGPVGVFIIYAISYILCAYFQNRRPAGRKRRRRR